MKPKRLILICILLIALQVSCAGGTEYRQESRRVPAQKKTRPYRVLGRWYKPMADAAGFRQQGIASWYGEKFHGRKTSSGEIYNMHKVSAAHKILPLGTWVEVTNLENQRQLTLRINDRGPFSRGRIIDLSKEAARRLGVLDPGTARVRIRALGRARRDDDSSEAQTPAQEFEPVDYYSGRFTLQVGAFEDRANAEIFRRELDKTYLNAHISPMTIGDETWYRVRVGSCTNLETAEQYEQILIQHGFDEAFVVAF